MTGFLDGMGAPGTSAARGWECECGVVIFIAPTYIHTIILISVRKTKGGAAEQIGRNELSVHVRPQKSALIGAILGLVSDDR